MAISLAVARLWVRLDVTVDAGERYANGFGVGRDVAEAIKWYSRAAKKGSRRSIDSLIKLVPALAVEHEAALVARAAERDAAALECEVVRAERDAARTERDAALAVSDAALAERDVALAERDAVLAFNI